MKRRITLSFLVTIFVFAMLLGLTPKTTKAETAVNYHAYMGIQSNTTDWIFRNPYDDADYGFGTDAFKGLRSIKGTKLTSYKGNFTDANLTKDGTYTVTLDNPDWASEKTLSQLYVSTDIPVYESIKVTNVIVTIDGKKIYTFKNAIINPESEKYVQIMCLNIWNDDVKDKFSVSLPFTKCEITFTISGLAEAAAAAEAEKNAYQFKEYKDYAVLTSYTGSKEVVEIPSTVNGKKVTEIGADAFNSKIITVTKVTIPDTVKKIGKNAFYGCTKLKSITIPANVTSIGDYAFYQTGLTSVNIPKSVTTIGIGVFGNCSALTRFTVTKGNTKYIAKEGVLFSITEKTLVQYPAGKSSSSYTVPKNVTTIQGGAFAGCAKLTKLTISKTVTTIGEGAFASCKNLTIYAPSGSVAYKYAEKNKIKVKKSN